MIEQDWLDYERDVLNDAPNVLLNEHVIQIMKMTFYIAAGLAARHGINSEEETWGRGALSIAHDIVNEVDKLLSPNGRLELVKGKVN